MHTKKQIFNKIWDVAVAGLAGVFNATAMAIFVKPNSFVSGGFSGLSIVLDKLLSPLISGVTGVADNVWLFYAILNVPLLVLAIIFLRGDYTFKTIFSVAVSTLVLRLIEGKLEFTASPIIAAIFGGILIGTSMYLASVHNGSNGGTEVVAKLINKRHSELDLSTVIMISDMSIMLVGCMLFVAQGTPVWVVLYSVIYVFVGSRFMGIMGKGFDHPQKYIIVTENAEELMQKITVKFKRGFSVIDVADKPHKKIIMVVVQYRQSQALKRMIKQCDSQAFSFVKDVDDVFSRPLFNRSYLK